MRLTSLLAAIISIFLISVFTKAQVKVNEERKSVGKSQGTNILKKVIVTGILLHEDGSPAVEKVVIINEWDGNDIVIRTTGKSEIEGFVKISTLSARTDANGQFTLELQRSIYGDQKEFAVAIQLHTPVFPKEGLNLKWAIDEMKKPVIFKIYKNTKKVDLGKITYDSHYVEPPGTCDYKHPYYWAAFEMIGDWQ